MKTFTLLLTMLIGVQAMAQEPAKISGQVRDAAGSPLAQATIMVMKAADSTLSKTAITDKAGVFSAESLKASTYYVVVSTVGMSDWQSDLIKIAAGEHYKLPVVSLKAVSNELESVVVSRRKPMIEVSADKTVFNVENSIVAQGSDALEMLSKTPGVQVDNNDNISMKGKTGVKIYVDGRLQQIGGKDLADYLRTINSNDIQSIEMISNPSAKYDASGNAGVINIKLKKNKNYGTNGSYNLGLRQGITPKGNGSLNLNYRNKKVNLFGNAGTSIGVNRNTMTLYREQNDSLYDQLSLNENKNLNFNTKVGADFFLDSRNTIGVMGTLSLNDTRMRSSSETPIYDLKTGALSRTLVAKNYIPGSRTNANINFNYRYADTSGRELNVDLDYGLFSGFGRSRQPNLYLNPDGSINDLLVYGNYTPTDINIYTAKADMEQKMGKGKLGYGVKFSYVNTDNTFKFFNVIGDESILDKPKSNNFVYDENVNAGYVNYNTALGKKWSVQAGLRVEQTNSKGVLSREDGETQEDDVVKRNYIDFFPSAALTWNLAEKHTLNLTYSRRIDRPTYQELNPFENKLDELTYQKGNAFLQPQYTDNVALTHIFMNMINTSVSYSYVKDYATMVTDTTNGSATYIQQRNLASQQVFNVSVGSPIPVAKWWNGYVNLWYNYQLFKGTFNNGVINEKVPGYGAYLQNSFTLNKKGLAAELTGWYNGPGVWGGTWRTKPMGSLDFGIQQPLFNKRASLKLSVTDIFFTSPWNAENNFGGVKIIGRGANESRTFRVNFSYRFGKSEVKAARNRKTGMETEAGRIKS